MHDHLRTTLAACALTGVLSAGAFVAPAAAKPSKTSSLAAARPAAHFADWVTASRDNGSLPFVIVDKLAASVFVYDADGRLTATTAALIGSAPGDDSAPGIGDKPLASIPPEERTTPAGRFVAAFRPNGPGQEVLWVDYETAVSLHPLREVTLSDPRERRLNRLNTPTPADNRITYGCINVPDAFYDEVVRPAFKPAGGIVYVLPETRPLAEVFPAFARRLADSETAGGKKKKKPFWKRLF